MIDADQEGIAFLVGGQDIVEDLEFAQDVEVAGSPGVADPAAEQVRDFFPEAFLFSIETLE